jgi:hypothetical protein
MTAVVRREVRGGFEGFLLERCTNMPIDLAEAVRSGQSDRPESGAGFETSVEVTLRAITPRD